MVFTTGVRRAIAFVAAILFLLPALLSSCSLAPAKRYATVVDGPFDTAAQPVIYAKKKSDADRFFSLFKEKLEEWDRLADIYYEYDGLNNLRTLNLSAGVSPVELDPRLLDLLEYGLTAKETTGGRVDLLLGPVLAIWHEYRAAALDDPNSAKRPTDEELSAASEIAKESSLVIDRTASTAYLPVPGSSVDVGAFAKGYATERICLELEELGYTDFAVNVGGNLRVSGSADGEPWTLSVRDPKGGGAVGETNARETVSLATSGSYQRYYVVDGVRYHHIVDPDTCFPAAFGWASVSVLTKDAGVADVLSTALFLLDREAGVSLLSRFTSPVSVLWIDENGEKYAFGVFAEGIE